MMRQRAFERLRSCNRCAKGELPRNAPVSWKLKRDFPRLGWSKRGRWHARPDARRRRQAALDSSKISYYWSCNANEAVWTIETDNCEYSSSQRTGVTSRPDLPSAFLDLRFAANGQRGHGATMATGRTMGTPRQGSKTCPRRRTGCSSTHSARELPWRTSSDGSRRC